MNAPIPTIAVDVWDANLAISFLMEGPTNDASRAIRDAVVERLRAALRAINEEAA